ncbi:hypothetical protein, partial [Streptomyces neyagawaensis]
RSPPAGRPAPGRRPPLARPAAGDEPEAAADGSPVRIPAGGVSIALAGFGARPSADGPHALLAVDSWVEVVPNAEEDTAVAYHADVPDNCAPQALLLAVHPDPGLPWDDDTVADVVRETAAFAELRTVDPDLLPAVGHLLPAVLLAQNVGGGPAGDTASTTLRG